MSFEKIWMVFENSLNRQSSAFFKSEMVENRFADVTFI